MSLHSILRSRRSRVTMLLGMAMTGLAGQAIAATQPAQAVQAAPSPAATTGTSRQIKKFSTDETLRQGMNRIAALLDASWPEIQDSRLQTPAYQALAKQVEQQTADIVKNCKLDARADHAFHEILADLNQSVALMQRNKAEVQRTGALALMQALRNYARYFDHPGWTGPQPQ